MSQIWCVRSGAGRGFYHELVACVASPCRRRKRCDAYAALPLEQLAAAIAAAKRNGHTVCEEFPLFESAAVHSPGKR